MDENKITNPRLVTDEDVSSSVTQQIALFEALSKRFDNKIDEFSKRIENELQHIHQSVEEVKNLHCKRDDKFRSIDNTLEEIQTCQEELDKKISTVINKQTNSEGAIYKKILGFVVGAVVIAVTVAVTYGRFDTAVSHNASRMTAIDSLVRANSEGRVRIDDHLSTIDKDMDKLDAKLSRHDDRISKSESRLIVIGETLANHSHRKHQ